MGERTGWRERTAARLLPVFTFWGLVCMYVHDRFIWTDLLTSEMSMLDTGQCARLGGRIVIRVKKPELFEAQVER